MFIISGQYRLEILEFGERTAMVSHLSMCSRQVIADLAAEQAYYSIVVDSLTDGSRRGLGLPWDGRGQLEVWHVPDSDTLLAGLNQDVVIFDMAEGRVRGQVELNWTFLGFHPVTDGTLVFHEGGVTLIGNGWERKWSYCQGLVTSCSTQGEGLVLELDTGRRVVIDRITGALLSVGE